MEIQAYSISYNLKQFGMPKLVRKNITVSTFSIQANNSAPWIAAHISQSIVFAYHSKNPSLYFFIKIQLISQVFEHENQWPLSSLNNGIGFQSI